MSSIIEGTWVINEAENRTLCVESFRSKLNWQSTLALQTGSTDPTRLVLLQSALFEPNCTVWDEVPVVCRRCSHGTDNVTEFNVAPFLAAPWGTFEFSVGDSESDVIIRYTAVVTSECTLPDTRAQHRNTSSILVLRHGMHNDEMCSVTAGELPRLSKALAAMVKE